MIFVTGTDTGCGKTTVGRAICAALKDRGIKVGVFKPVETGCAEQEGSLLPADAIVLARAAGCELPIETICPYRFKKPASPERAARSEDISIDLNVITLAWEKVQEASEFVVAEGAGGLLVPITKTVMMADLPAILGLPVIVVVRDALGTINHTLLTLEAIRARGMNVLGVVFSTMSPFGGLMLDNVEDIRVHGKVTILGNLPNLSCAEDASDTELAQLAEAHLDLESIVNDQVTKL